MKRKKKILRKKVLKSRGAIGSGMMFVMILVLIAGAIAFTLVGGQLPQLNNSQVGNSVVIVTPAKETAKKNLQLYTFLGLTVTPTVPPAITNGCGQSQFNTEDEILVGSDPAPGAATSGMIRVWVTDELPPRISPNEEVDPITGMITTPGDRTATDVDSDGQGNYLWEPTVYVKLATGAPPTQPFCDVNSTDPTCTPHFPISIKGDYNSTGTFSRGNATNTKGPAVDDWTLFKNGPGMANNQGGNRNGQILDYNSEYIWDATTFNLTTGTYWAQFVIHDGDSDMAISCITVQIP